MTEIGLPGQLRACVIASMRDAPEHLTEVAGALQRHFPLRVAVLVYTPQLALASFPRLLGPSAGPGVGAAIAAKREADRAQKQVHNIERAMQMALPGNQKPEVTCARGSPYRLGRRLCQDFDSLVVPGRLGAVGLWRRWFPGSHLKLASASHAPTLFCAGLPPWERVIVLDSGDRASWIARRALLHLADQVGFSLNVVRLEKLASGGSWGPQESRCLVVSLPAVRRVFAPRALSGHLRSWTGACLLWP